MLRANVLHSHLHTYMLHTLFTATHGSPNTQKWHKKDTSVDLNEQFFL